METLTATKAEIKLTVYLHDGRTLSGSYSTDGALARLDFARKLSNFAGFHFSSPEVQP